MHENPTNNTFPQLPHLLRYKREVAVVFILLGVLNLGLGVWLFLLGEFHFTLILGLLIIFIGFGYFTKPMASIHIDQVVLYNLLGMKVKSYVLTAFSDLKLQGRNLYIQREETQQPIHLATWLVHSQDWQQLQGLLQSHPQLQAK
jgi:hypothetical protein